MRGPAPYDRGSVALALPNGSFDNPSLRFGGARSGLSRTDNGDLAITIKKSLALGISDSNLLIRSNTIAPIVTPLTLDRANATLVDGEETTLDVQEVGITTVARLAAYRETASRWGWKLYGFDAGLNTTPILQLSGNGSVLIPDSLVVGGIAAFEGETHVGGTSLSVTAPTTFSDPVTIEGGITINTPSGLTPPVGIGGPGVNGALLSLYPTGSLQGLVQGSTVPHALNLTNAAPNASPTAFARLGLAAGGTGYLGAANSFSIYTDGAAAGALILGTANAARLTIATDGAVLVPGAVSLGSTLGVTGLLSAGGLTVTGALTASGSAAFSGAGVTLAPATPLTLNRTAGQTALDIPSGNVSIGNGTLALNLPPGNNAITIPSGNVLMTNGQLTLNRGAGQRALDVPTGDVRIGGALSVTAISSLGIITGTSLNVTGSVTGGSLVGSSLNLSGGAIACGPITAAGNISTTGAGTISTTNAINGGAISGSSLNTGAGAITTSGAVSSGSLSTGSISASSQINALQSGGNAIYAPNGSLYVGVNVAIGGAFNGTSSTLSGGATALSVPNGAGSFGGGLSCASLTAHSNGPITTGGGMSCSSIAVSGGATALSVPNGAASIGGGLTVGGGITTNGLHLSGISTTAGGNSATAGGFVYIYVNSVQWRLALF